MLAAALLNKKAKMYSVDIEEVDVRATLLT
jgi:hypothetical protein